MKIIENKTERQQGTDDVNVLSRYSQLYLNHIPEGTHE